MVISPEPGTTTLLLESMILGKPTMNIYFENEVPQFNHVKHNAVFSLLDTCDLNIIYLKYYLIKNLKMN